MNELIPANMGQLSTRFQGLAIEDDLSAGIAGGFGSIGYKGKVWSIRHRGTEMQLMRDDGDGPRGSIEVVILKASGTTSKIWYEGGYVEGSTASPDCFSTNAVTPDAASTKKQSPTCATCPRNAWGSRITPAGKAGKECSDSKRITVVPAQDIRNEMFGGALLLRVPAASLQDLAAYGKKMTGVGYPYFGVATRIAFDPNEAFPKFTFGAIRALTDAEADVVLEMRNSPEVARILAEDVPVAHVAEAPAPTVSSVFEQPPQQPVAQPVQQTQAPQPQPVAQPVQQPVQQTSGFGATAPIAQAQPTAAPVASAKPVVQQAGGFGAVAAVTPEVAPVQQTAAAADPRFQQNLDEMLEALLPK